jgi:hypothetical protein
LGAIENYTRPIAEGRIAVYDMHTEARIIVIVDHMQRE